MKEESILYCFMNKNFEFLDIDDNLIDDLKEAVGFSSLEKAIEYRNKLDDPEIWKIVKIRMIYKLEEISDENV